MASIGLNGNIDMSEAAKVLGCSRATVNNLRAAGKLKAQKVEGRWFLKYDEVYRMKPHVKPRKSKKAKRAAELAQNILNARPAVLQGTAEVLPKVAAPLIAQGSTDESVRFQIEQTKLELISFVCRLNGTTLSDYIRDSLNELYERSLNGLKFTKATPSQGTGLPSA
jgi:excisionase family DNA binding protein